MTKAKTTPSEKPIVEPEVPEKAKPIREVKLPSAASLRERLPRLNIKTPDLRKINPRDFRLEQLREARAQAYLVIALGIVLRVIQYLSNRSLWIDEAALSLNILHRSYGELFQPLDYNQGAPIGYLLVTKMLTSIFGDSEFVLRFFPLVAGITSLLLLYLLLRRYIQSRWLLLPLFIFAISAPLIYYSSEAKQYSTDMLVVLLLILASLRLNEEPLTWERAFVFGGLGMIALWFSYAAIFALAGIGLVLAIAAILRRDIPRLLRLVVVGVMWGLSFAALYAVAVQSLSANDYLRDYFTANFLPILPLRPIETLRWLIENFFRLFSNPQGLELNAVAALPFLVGCAVLYARKRTDLFILLAPILATLVISALGKYPFGGRLLLFGAPILLVLIGVGLDEIAERTRQSIPALAVALVALLLISPLYELTNRINWYPQEIKPVLDYVSHHRMENDEVYVYYFSQLAYDYYAPRYGFTPDDTIIGRSWVDNHWADTTGAQIVRYNDDLDELDGKPYVWVIFSNANTDERLYTGYLERMGRLVDSVKVQGASAYLYALNE